MTKAEQMILEYKLNQQKYEQKSIQQKDYAMCYICGAIAALVAVGLGIFLWRSKEVA